MNTKLPDAICTTNLTDFKSEKKRQDRRSISKKRFWRNNLLGKTCFIKNSSKRAV